MTDEQATDWINANAPAEKWLRAYGWPATTPDEASAMTAHIVAMEDADKALEEPNACDTAAATTTQPDTTP